MSPSLLKGNFTGHRLLQYFFPSPLNTLNISLHSILAGVLPEEMWVVILNVCSSPARYFLPLALFRIFSLSLIFYNGEWSASVSFFCFFVYQVCGSWSCQDLWCVSDIHLEEILSHYCFRCFCSFLSFFSQYIPFGVVQKSLDIPLLFSSVAGLLISSS